VNDKDRKHWQAVYASNDAQAVSWYRAHLDVSLRMLENAGLDTHSRVVDIGGGASTLVDDLLDRGVGGICVLDLSDAALAIARQRLGARAATVDWRVGDVTRAQWPDACFDFWHDRAVMHFLSADADLRAYLSAATSALRIGGHIVVGGFARDGPQICSGLPVARREPEALAALFGEAFQLVDQAHELHSTPLGRPQHFAYATLRRLR